MWSLYASYWPIYIDEGRLNNRHTSVYKCSLAAPQNASCKMIIELNRRLSTKTEHNNLHEGRFYCRSAVFDCISRQLSIYSLILWSSIQFKCNGASLVPQHNDLYAVSGCENGSILSAGGDARESSSQQSTSNGHHPLLKRKERCFSHLYGPVSFFISCFYSAWAEPAWCLCH